MRSGVRGVSGPQQLRLAVVGTGLIGASVGLAAKRAGDAGVAGFDADERSLAQAVERGAIDVPCQSMSDAVDDADIVVVAVPVVQLPWSSPPSSLQRTSAAP